MQLNDVVKRVDGFFASYFTRWFSLPFVWIFSKIGISPNIVTLISLVFGLWAAYAFLHQQLILGALLVQISFMFDCVDGQLARYIGKGSPFGAWLDTVTDRIKEFLVLFSLGMAYNMPWLAFFAIFASAMRHYDFSKRKELGITLEGTRQAEKKEVADGWPRFKAILKESLLFGISERWAAVTIFALLGWVQELFIFLIIIESFVLITKTSVVWIKRGIH